MPRINVFSGNLQNVLINQLYATTYRQNKKLEIKEMQTSSAKLEWLLDISFDK